jgi:LysR family transcriptional regulator, cys regulon transcriptional activator
VSSTTEAPRVVAPRGLSLPSSSGQARMKWSARAPDGCSGCCAAKQGIKPDLVLTAMDADVIKTYVELGLGVGIVASIAFDEGRDLNLRAIDAGHLFAVNLTKLGVRRGSFLRGYVYDFIETFASPLKRAVVDEALASVPGTRFEG